MKAVDVLGMFDRFNVIRRNGHYAYTSDGRHGSSYVNKDALYPHARETSQLCFELADRALNLCGEIDCVVGPEKGGIVLAQWVGFFLSLFTQCEVASIFAEKVIGNTVDGAPHAEPGFAFLRGYAELVRGKNVLIVEDVTNTGGTVKKLVKLVEDSGGRVQGIGAICNRGNIVPEDIGSPPRFFALLDISLKSWNIDECPLCAEGVPLDKEFRKGKELLLAPC